MNGPWKAEKSGIYDATGLCVAMRHPQAGSEWIKNAPVLAASSEMLLALEDCIKAYEQHRDNQPTGHLWPDPNHIFWARQALAKSRGEECIERGVSWAT